MNPIKITAIGRAGHAVLAHLHGHPTPAIALDHPLDLKAVSAPKTRDDLATHIRLALAATAAEMNFASLPSTHISEEREEVLRAIELAERLGGGHPIDILETQLDHTLATLRSPKVWHSIRTLGAAVLRCPRGEMPAERVRHVIRQALADNKGPNWNSAGHPRRITVRP
ncbi:MAG: hypothetical protein ACLQJR_05805 [Stellaceae bacterium]